MKRMGTEKSFTLARLDFKKQRNEFLSVNVIYNFDMYVYMCIISIYLDIFPLLLVYHGPLLYILRHSLGVCRPWRSPSDFHYGVCVHLVY